MNRATASAALQDEDMILFSYPVYTFIVPSQLHRFIDIFVVGFFENHIISIPPSAFDSKDAPSRNHTHHLRSHYIGSTPTIDIETIKMVSA